MATNIAEANAKSRNAFLGFDHILFIVSIGFSYAFWNIQFISIFYNTFTVLYEHWK